MPTINELFQQTKKENNISNAKGYLEVARSLIEADADVNEQDQHGNNRTNNVQVMTNKV